MAPHEQDQTAVSLEDKLAKIRNASTKSNQKQNTVVLSAIEGTLKEQNTAASPTAYFAALLSLLQQAIPDNNTINNELALPIVYLLDIVMPYAPAPLLRSKFKEIIERLAPALTHAEADNMLLRSSIGCLEHLLIAQDGAQWAIPPTQIGPRTGLAGLLHIAMSAKPKVRKRAQEAITNVLQAPPPSPKLDHPAAEMCASTALQSLANVSSSSSKAKGQHDPAIIHGLQLVSAIAKASGWPTAKIEPLAETLLEISKTSNEFLTLAVFEVFDTIFSGLEDEVTSPKLPIVIEAISSLRPNKTDAQILPPWLAAMSRGYEVLSKVDEEKAFKALPELFELASTFLESPAENIRTSASQFLISLTVECIPDSVIDDCGPPEAMLLDKLASQVTDLLSVRYQGAWMEVFDVLSVFLEKLRWRGSPSMHNAVKIVGELRGNEGFQGKKQADEVLGHAIGALGPEVILKLLPLNLTAPKAGQPGRAWLLPLLRDNVANTDLSHFVSEFVPLSQVIYGKIKEYGESDKTVESKIFETIIQQIWTIFPGYCDTPLDLKDAFNKEFAEMISNLLYQQVDLRVDICKGLQNLVESNKLIAFMDEETAAEALAGQRLTQEEAKENVKFLSAFCSNILAVLFNVYTNTLPQFRQFILLTINSFLSITSEAEIQETFGNVVKLLESALPEAVALSQAEKQKQANKGPKMPPMAHTLMDLVITIAPYLPTGSHDQLLSIFQAVLNKKEDPQLQKKSYKIISRLAESENGAATLKEKSEALQQILIESMESVSPPSRRDRLAAMTHVVKNLAADDLHFIPSVISEVVISAKEVNEKARVAAFDLLVEMGNKMKAGGTVVNSKVPHMPDDAPSVAASLEEYFTMVGAGLAGSTPHMISASVTALTRILYEFREELSESVLTDLVSTMDLFLTSKNREIVQSVLGFVKVSVISLPKEMMIPRLPSLIQNLMVWSHEHKAHFRAKVKHILERMIRRFGYDLVEKHVPAEDKKLIVNIRKTKERRKRGKEAEKEEGKEEGAPVSRKTKSRFESEFDEAIYGSESEEEGSGDEDVDMDADKKRGKKKGSIYIVEGEQDDPLDLLDRKSLAHISSTRPQKARAAKLKSKPKFNADGKMVFGGDSDDEGEVSFKRGKGGDDGMDVDMDGADAGSGVNAYMDAVSGKDAFTRGQRNRIKFSNKKGGREEEDSEDEDSKPAQRKPSFDRGHQRRDSGGRGGRGGGFRGGRGGDRGGRGGRGGGDRGFRGVRGGGVQKSGRGRGGPRR